MEGVGSFGSRVSDSARTPAKGILLAVVIVIFLSGSAYPLSAFHRSITWLLWIAMVWSIYLFSKELPLQRLIRPVMPYLFWLIFYLTWALIVSPMTNIAYAGKIAVTTMIFATAVAVLTAKKQYLQTFASVAQFAVVANLVIWMLIPWSPKVALLVANISESSDPILHDLGRYGGMIGNPNLLGYVCLVVTLLSVFAVPWAGWLGRLSCIPLLYLTASRKASVLYLVILILYVVIVQRRNLKFWVASMILIISLASALLLGDGLRERTRNATNDPTITRLMDLQEKHTNQAGGITRADLLFRWVSVLHKAPWYGYGLEAMVGTVYDKEHPERVVVRGPYPVGAHNTYLGVWIEIGPVGFIVFILMLLYYARLCLVADVDPQSKWVLVSFLLVNLAFLFVSHSHLFCFEGKISFALFFLLPTAPALLEMRRRQARSA